jgi:hypothetical protein
MARSMVLARPRHRRRSRGAVSRAVTFGPAVAVPAWGWGQLGQLGHLAGLAVMTVLGVAIIPAAIVLVIFLVPYGPAALVPRKWRKRYRHWRGPREAQRSARISKFLRRVTYAADRHRCTYCRKPASPGIPLQVDHYLPWSQGGLTTPWNTMTLCRDCNLTKSNYWRGVFYRPVEGHEDTGLAAAILAAERRHRYNPLRLTRAAWALGA